MATDIPAIPGLAPAPGMLSQRVHRFDWSRTPLGPMGGWPPALRIAAEFVLESRFPMCLVWGPAHTMIFNDGFSIILGDKKDALGRSFADVWSEVWDAIGPMVDRAYAGEATYIEDFALQIDRHGFLEEAFFTFCYSPLRDETGAVVGMIDTVIETTSKFVATRRMQEWGDALEKQMAERTADRDRMWRLSSDLMVICERNSRVGSVNPAWTRLLGWQATDVVDRSLAYFLHLDDREPTERILAGLPESGAAFRFETRCRCRDGSFRLVEWETVPDERLLLLIGRDMTASRAQAEALRQSQAALGHAQKMESIGQLTGGVAHDFNNLLQVISGNLQLLSKALPLNEKGLRYVASAQAGVRRGAKLASQLLSFARKQPLEPEVVNIGRLIPGVQEMLGRTLGEGVEIEVVTAGALWNCFIDAAQMENALLNLAINARDAMDGLGRLTIECANVHLDDAYARTHTEVAAGQYVMLAVTDTGSGMAPEVLEKAFDPFFSTKGEGKGSGLGLSMVFGFVKQSGGHIHLYSEPGHGTTVKIYLPRVLADEDRSAVARPSFAIGGAETILVAEDDDAVRDTVIEFLTELGYNVLMARDAASALAIIESGVKVDVLFTDVVMPGTLRSPDLAARARQKLPGIAVLFTSGYTNNAIIHGGRLDAGVDLIGKPYTQEALGQKIRLVLEKARR